MPTADLRRWVAEAGGADVRTYAQSGNILLELDGEPSPPNPLSQAWEKGGAQRRGEGFPPATLITKEHR